MTLLPEGQYSGGRTRVVNLHRSPYDVYIGRAGQGQDGYFGNPCRGNRRDAIEAFRTYFHARLGTDVEFKRRVEELRGKRLGCFCAPKECHGDVIVEYLEARGK